MRYIDADRLPIKVWNGDFVGVSKNDIEQTPTEDVVSVIYGEWVKDEEHSVTIDMYKCNRCNQFGLPRYNYCYNCGAKMKRGDKSE